jgi:hypothetical protein
MSGPSNIFAIIVFYIVLIEILPTEKFRYPIEEDKKVFVA